jgi:tetratricopeptide (TPR) repeat protein
MDQYDDQSVRHLVELGYVDPDKVTAHHAEVLRQQHAALRQAKELTSTGRLQDAAILSQQLVTADPDWPAPRQLLAEINYRQGQLVDAQAQLDWLTYHGVEHPRLALIGGAIALTRRELQAAMELLDYACHVDPALPSVHTLYGWTLLRVGKLDQAADAFQRATGQRPTDARALDGLASMCLRAGRFEEAADWALKAVEQNTQLFHAHYHLGLALKELGRSKEALQAFEISAQMDRTRCAPYHWLANIAELGLNDPVLAANYRQQGRKVVQDRRVKRNRNKALAPPIKE